MKNNPVAQSERSMRLEQGITQRGPYIQTKVIQQSASKLAIARHVAEQYVRDFDAVLLDAGSTAELIAEELFIQRKYLAVMTNNMGAYAAYTRAITSPKGERAASPENTGRSGPLYENELLLPGGRYDPTYEALFGDRTIEAIRTFSPNVTVIGVSGLLFDKGIFCHGAEEVRVKKLLLTIPADTRVIAADWTKIGKRDAHAFGDSVEQLKLGVKRAVVVTNKPPRNASSDERKEFDEQIRRMEESRIIADVLDVPEQESMESEPQT